MAEQIHAVHDSASKERQQQYALVEQHRDMQRVAWEAMERTSAWIEETDIDNIERQSGQRMARTEFERRVQILCPSVRFCGNIIEGDNARAVHLEPGTKTRCMLQLLPDGTTRYLGGYLDQPLLPEKSIILTRKERIPAPIDKTIDLKGDDGTWERIPYIDGKDIPKSEWDGKGYQFDRSVSTPGEQWVKKPVGMIRGWRTMLAQLVLYGLATPNAIEREFGSLDSASWAKYMGKKDVTLAH